MGVAKILRKSCARSVAVVASVVAPLVARDVSSVFRFFEVVSSSFADCLVYFRCFLLLVCRFLSTFCGMSRLFLFFFEVEGGFRKLKNSEASNLYCFKYKIDRFGDFSVNISTTPLFRFSGGRNRVNSGGFESRTKTV